jgi:3-methyladenine DNA glycosylase AlkD
MDNRERWTGRRGHSLLSDISVSTDSIVEELRALGCEANRDGMARFGINVGNAFGVSVTNIRKIGRRYPRDHRLAQALWDTGWHECRILASVIDDPSEVTPDQMDQWVSDFDSWDLCDQCCGNLFDKAPFAWKKAVEWSRSEVEFTKRAGFAMMAALARHDKTAPDRKFRPLLRIIENRSDDNRNFVRKAVNWALREIGKRNPALREEAIATAERILARDTPAARWIARDALRELNSVRAGTRSHPAAAK